MYEAESFENLSDLELVTLIIQGNSAAIEYLLFEKCSALFAYITREVFKDSLDKNDLINDFYLFLHQNNWSSLRSFQGKSQLTTWLSVVATRFFIKKRKVMIDFHEKNTQYYQQQQTDDFHKTMHAFDQFELYDAIHQMANARYRFILLSELYGDEPQEIANQLQISIDNYYNLKHRARLQLLTLLKQD